MASFSLKYIKLWISCIAPLVVTSLITSTAALPKSCRNGELCRVGFFSLLLSPGDDPDRPRGRHLPRDVLTACRCVVQRPTETRTPRTHARPRDVPRAAIPEKWRRGGGAGNRAPHIAFAPGSRPHPTKQPWFVCLH